MKKSHNIPLINCRLPLLTIGIPRLTLTSPDILQVLLKRNGFWMAYIDDFVVVGCIKSASRKRLLSKIVNLTCGIERLRVTRWNLRACLVLGDMYSEITRCKCLLYITHHTTTTKKSSAWCYTFRIHQTSNNKLNPWEERHPCNHHSAKYYVPKMIIALTKWPRLVAKDNAIKPKKAIVPPVISSARGVIVFVAAPDIGPSILKTERKESKKLNISTKPDCVYIV